MIRSFLAGLGWGGVIAAMGLGVLSQVAPFSQAKIGADAPGQTETAPPAAGPTEPAYSEAAPPAAVPAPQQTPLEPALPALGAPSVPAPPDEAPDDAPEPLVDAASPRAGDVAALDAPPDGPLLQAPTPALPPPALLPPALLPPTLAPDAPAEIVAPPEQPVRRPAGFADAPLLAEPAAPAALEIALGLAEPAPAREAPAPRLPAIAPADGPPPEADLPPTPPAPPPPAPPPPAPPPPAVVKQLPVPRLDEPVAGVVIGRLPRIGVPPPPAPAAAEAPPDAPPFIRYARAFENPDALPLFAIILQDTGGADVDRARLAALPYPVSFAIDPMQPGAEAAAAIYREAGQEVLMLASGIPAGARAADLEQTFQAHGRVLAEAVAVIDLPDGGFQNNRPEARLVLPIVQAQGRGIVTYAQGLNAAAQLAARDGVPGAEIFRKLDAENEASPVIRRYLDRAAFKAAQEGQVVVIGKTRPETIAALADWALEGRSRTVALAPVSAAMRASGR